MRNFNHCLKRVLTKNFQNTKRLIFKIQNNTSYSKQGRLNLPQKIIFNIVSQTQNYSQFIPWCKSSKIIQKKSQFQNKTELQIQFNSFKQNYVSKVRIYQEQKRYLIHSVCKDSPLEYLDSKWYISKSKINQNNSSSSYSDVGSQIKYQTLIKYNLNFQFDSWTYRMASGVFIDYLGEQMWDIFTKRALNIYRNHQIYGNLDRFLQKNHEIKEKYLNNIQIKSDIDKIWNKYCLKVDSSINQKLSQEINIILKK